jgi:hypothetical protein
VGVQSAVACGITRKGSWGSSKTPSINSTLLYAYLKSEGLVSLGDGWSKFTTLSETPCVDLYALCWVVGAGV